MEQSFISIWGIDISSKMLFTIVISITNGVFLILILKYENIRRLFKELIVNTVDGAIEVISAFVGLPSARHKIGNLKFDITNNLEFSDEELIRLKRLFPTSQTRLSKDAENTIVELHAAALKNGYNDEIKSILQNLINISIDKEIDKISEIKMNSARIRLENSASSVSVRGMVSLLIGIFSAIGALLILREAVFTYTLKELTNLPYQAIIFVTSIRISLAVFVIFISYFFLSLYRRSLDEIKYYQNEITNIDTISTAIILSNSSDSNQVKAYTISKLMELDRNTFSQQAYAMEKNSPQNIKISDEILKSLIDKIPLK